MFSIRNIASNGREDIKTITAICDAYCSPRTKFFECGEKLPINSRPVSWYSSQVPKAAD